MTRAKIYGGVVASRLPDWITEGLDRMTKAGETRSDTIRKILGDAVLSSEVEEEGL